MGRSDGGYIGIKKIINKGPDGARWDLLIFAEGYQIADLGDGKKFDKDARALVADLLLVSPFNEFKSAINVHRVDTWSTEKGAWTPQPCGPPGPPRKTLFNAQFCTGGRKEYLTVNTDAVKELATAIYPQFDALVVLVNEDEYGGSGDSHVAVVTRKPSTRKLVAHELAHAAFALDDEYERPGTHGTEEPHAANVTIETRATHIKWKALLSPGVQIPTTLNPACGATMTTTPPPGTVGAFEGGRSRTCKVFRPSLKCQMRDFESGFCRVCKAQIRALLTPFLP